MNSLRRLNSGGWPGRIASCGFVCLLIFGCATVSTISYSLKDSEIFIAPRSHPIQAAVAVLNDRRPPEEQSGFSRVGGASDLPIAVTERIVRHLEVSAVFSRVQRISGPVDPTSTDRLREWLTQGLDAVLIGDLTHFYGRTDPGGRIEGQVQFSDLKLYSTHTGLLVWQGTVDKHLQRLEKNPGRAEFYASEALRGAVNQLAIQIAGLSSSGLKVYSENLPDKRRWRVGVLLPQDLRPSEDKGAGEQGYHDGSARISDQIARQWIAQLRAADIFGDVVMIPAHDASAEELREWSEEGIDAVLIGKLIRSFGSATPAYDSKPFQIWSGGMGYPRRFRASALTRLEEVRLIETRGGKVLWQGESEYGIDRMILSWTSSAGLMQESLTGALKRLVKQLSDLIVSGIEPSSVP